MITKTWQEIEAAAKKGAGKSACATVSLGHEFLYGRLSDMPVILPGMQQSAST